jgi:DNA transformation protein
VAVSAEFRDHVAGMLEPLGPVGIRRMFGGAGVYCGAVMFGLIADDVLYFKVDAENRPAYESAGSKPFVYEPGGGRKVAMSYWRVPDRLLDDGEEMIEWANKALEAARRSRSIPATGRRRSR